MGKHSLQARFVAVVLFAYVAAGLAMTAFFVGLARRWAADLAAGNARREALLQRSRVAALVEPEVALARKLADDPVLQRWAAQEDDPPLRAAALEALESYRRAFRDHGFFFVLDGSLHYYVWDPAQGRVVVSQLSRARPADRWYFGLVERAAPYELNLDWNETIRRSKVWINVPVRGQGGRVLGVAGGGIDISDFLAQVLAGADAEAATVLIDGAGALQAHPNRDYVERNALALGSGHSKVTLWDLARRPAQAEALRAALARLAAGQGEAETLPLDVGGRPLLAAVTYVPQLGWYALVLVDPAHAVSIRQFLPLLAAAVVAVAALLAVLLAMLHRGFLRPVAALTAAAGQLRAGDYRVRVPVPARRHEDEVGLLSQTFNGMAETIEQARARLEERVAERTRQLTEANGRLEASQAAIQESLEVAREIQAAALPEPGALAAGLGPHALVYRPRDQVGGDFYWFRPAPGGFWLAVADCTGHGVPGAFMSLLALGALGEAADAGPEDGPAAVLRRLGHLLRDRVHQPGADQGLDAGLDVALCRWHAGGRRLVFAGAGLPLLVCAGGDTRVVSGDRHRVGYHGSDPDHAFPEHALALGPGDRVYLTTDGALDQAGGPRGFGLGLPRLAEALRDLGAVPMAEQAARLEALLAAWAGPHPQRDDVTLLGFAADHLQEPPA